ncbi:hypothetical protein OA067_02840 [Gammaproteobacteria bacterium]|nr:hypothetical protein [Gammaproteobacteria bacterium]
MNRSQYLKALGVEQWKLRRVNYVTEAKEQSRREITKNLPFVYFVLNFGSLKLCFHEVNEILLKKQIWRDLAIFAVKSIQTEKIEKREFSFPHSKEQSTSSIKRPSLIETIFSESDRVIFFGLVWPEICPEIAELTHMDKKQIGSRNVLLLRSVDEFIKTPIQKRQVMMIMDGWR